jgi:hypothetical protein
MSLIKCPECSKKVSDKAISCPDCGYPIRQENNDCLPLPKSSYQITRLTTPDQSSSVLSKGSKAVILFFVTFSLLSVLLMAVIEPEITKETYPKASKPLSPDEKRLGKIPFGEAVVSVYLKQSLNDPSSLKDLNCGRITAGSSAWEIDCKYRAKNSFGGYVVENRRFLLKGNNVVGHD